jgi:hypothetical protein
LISFQIILIWKNLKKIFNPVVYKNFISFIIYLGFFFFGFLNLKKEKNSLFPVGIKKKNCVKGKKKIFSFFSYIFFGWVFFFFFSVWHYKSIFFFYCQKWLHIQGFRLILQEVALYFIFQIVNNTQAF